MFISVDFEVLYLLGDIGIHRCRDGIEIGGVLEIVDIEPATGLAGRIAEDVFQGNRYLDAFCYRVNFIVSDGGMLTVVLNHIKGRGTDAQHATIQLGEDLILVTFLQLFQRDGTRFER